MALLIVMLLFLAVIAIYDSIRRVNNNSLEQTEEIRSLREDFQQFTNQ